MNRPETAEIAFCEECNEPLGIDDDLVCEDCTDKMNAERDPFDAADEYFDEAKSA